MTITGILSVKGLQIFKQKRILMVLLLTSGLLLGFVLFLECHIKITTASQILSGGEEIPNTFTTILVPGAGIIGGQPGYFFKARMDKAIEMKEQFPRMKILISADNGKQGYDETSAGLEYLLKKGILTGDIFLDFAGFDTYDSIYRAQALFKAKDLLIISQKFALPRALFIANRLGVPVVGMPTKEEHISFRNHAREKFANVKAFFETLIKRKPTFLGEAIPLCGTSNSWEFLEKKKIYPDTSATHAR